MNNDNSNIRVIGLIQMGCTADPLENLQIATKYIREAAERGAQIICLPELFISKYFCQTDIGWHHLGFLAIICPLQ